MCLGILTGLIGLAIAINSIQMYETKRKELDAPPKKKEPPTLSEAVEAIRQYCRNQEEEGRCAFNRNESNAVCDCRLLKNIPEDWSNADNKE